MRSTFILLIDFRRNIRRHEKHNAAEEIQAFASKQNMQIFGFEEGYSGTYAFKAHPDYIDESSDSYEIESFRRILEPWLINHKDIDSFTLQPVIELSQLFSIPRIASYAFLQTTDNTTRKDNSFSLN